MRRMTHTFTLQQARDLAVRALTASGAGPAAAESVARAVVDAHAQGRANVGFEHLPYYCDALRRGAVDGTTEPTVERVRPGVLAADAHAGFSHFAFDRAMEPFAAMVESQGAAVLTIRNTYTCGCLGYFPARLADRGFIAVAATNAGPAAVAPAGGRQAVFSTNPLAFAFPRPGRPPLLIDQSSSACTLVDVRSAREKGEPIPGGWALNRAGSPTTDAAEALEGAFKPFGGYKGSNIALMVELLAAGLSGGNWSIDAPSFADDPDCPGVGQWLLAMDVDAMAGGASERVDRYLDRIAELGAHVPGALRQERLRRAQERGIDIPPELYDRIQTCCRPA